MQSVTIDREMGANRLLLLILSIMIIICETPYLSRNMSTTVVVLLMVMFIIGGFIGKSKLSIDDFKTIVVVFFYIVIEALYKVVGLSTAGVGYYFATIKFLFLFYAAVILIPQLTEKQKKFILAISIIGLLLNMVSNVIIFLGMNSSAYVVYYLRDGQSTNAADTAFSSAVMILMGTTFICFLHIRRLVYRIISMAILIFCGYFLIFVAQRGTTFFLSIMMIAVLIACQASSKIIIWLMVFFAFLMFWFAMGGAVRVLTLLSDILAAQRINFKIDYLIRLFETGQISEAGGSLTDRFNLIMRSINTFFESFKNFMLGAGDHRDNNLIIGNHSQIIDTFARYGLLGGIVFILLIIKMKNKIITFSKTTTGTALRRQVLTIFIFFLSRSFLGNTLVGSIGTQLFFTAPIVVSILVSSHEDIR